MVVSRCQTAKRFADVAVAADHVRQRQAELVKRRQLQQETPRGQIKTVENLFFIIKEDFLPNLIGDRRVEALAIHHVPRQNGQGQRITAALFVNGRQHQIVHFQSMVLQQLSHRLPVESQRFGPALS